MVREQWKKDLIETELAEKGDKAEPNLPPKKLAQTASSNGPHKPHSANHGHAVSFPDLGDANRTQAVKMLFATLAAPEVRSRLKELEADNLYLDDKNLLEYVLDIEQAVYRHPEAKDYFKYMRERVLILKNKNNDNLKYSMLLGELSVQDFVTQEAHELESEETKKRIQEGREWKMKS